MRGRSSAYAVLFIFVCGVTLKCTRCGFLCAGVTLLMLQVIDFSFVGVTLLGNRSLAVCRVVTLLCSVLYFLAWEVISCAKVFIFVNVVTLMCSDLYFHVWVLLSCAAIIIFIRGCYSHVQ